MLFTCNLNLAMQMSWKTMNSLIVGRHSGLRRDPPIGNKMGCQNPIGITLLNQKSLIYNEMAAKLSLVSQCCKEIASDYRFTGVAEEFEYSMLSINTVLKLKRINT